MAKEVPMQLQEPEKPPAKSKGMKPVMLIGIIGGVLVVQAIIVFVLFKFIASPQQPAEPDKHNNNGKSRQKTELTEEDEFSEDQKLIGFYETGRISTNPKASTQLVAVNLGIAYRFKDEDSKKEMEKEGGEGKSSGGPFQPKTVAMIKGVVNNVLGSYTADDLLSKRDSLAIVLKNNLKPVLRQNQLFLKDVIVQEFIVQ